MERRAHPRFPLVLTVQYADAEAMLDYTENLSVDGLFVRTERHFEAGERVTLVLSFPQLLEPVELVVEVVRRRDGSDGEPAGVAVRVPETLAESRAKLAEVSRVLMMAARIPEPTYRILLAEDNSLVAQMYAAALRKLSEQDKIEGLGVEVCNDGSAAWDRLVRKPPIDLLITDVFMPILSGLDLVGRLRDEPTLSQLPVVVITSGGEREQEALRDLGVTLFLQKPVKYPELADTVRFLLRAREGKVTAPPPAATRPARSRAPAPAPVIPPPSPKPLTTAEQARIVADDDPSAPRR